ncbi:GAF domain-containing protein [Kineococcus radiotolerans]|uniref:Methyl-accepting chemotaxis sensory transducer n=1 Tax=Kineococcus radiotolerans (strain ATCC BAA-149 / DSM 14245 / SRS30216) TaxID=266940 RepID=A6WGI5_KINRD|nr:GAF domain-containing protein [Kineococcus radiotolerans]ABS05924.1 methyl-accepting chemotaxis sensory transducer [Kineococcus radiotolerans SRS30216 = ATCC BAA-149]
MFGRTSARSAAAGRSREVEEARADVEAVTEVVRALDGARTPQEAVRVALDTVRERFGWAYGSYWRLHPGTGAVARGPAGGPVLRFEQESGDAGEDFRRVTLEASFAEGVGLSGRAWRERDLVFVPDLARVTDCVRAPVAQRAGIRSGICFPVLDAGRVVGTMDFFTTEQLSPSPARLAVLRSVGTLVSAALARLHEAVRQEKAAQDVAAVSTVIRELTSATGEEQALRTALDTIRRDFDWQYGSFWRLDDSGPAREHALRFELESGDAGAEFRRVTLEASFARGVGLSGRAWASEDLVFVEDLGQVTDCVRAPVAQRAGVKSGVCLPILVAGRVVGTMDFFATRTLVMSTSRESALRNTAFLIGQAMERFAAARRLADAGGELLTSIGEVERNVVTATDVASRGEQLTVEANAEVAALTRASAEISQVVRTITAIAAQTKLLALNATIEAARAGEAGRGFAIVAEEVKELSGETERATTDVGAQVATIQARVEAVTSSLAQIQGSVEQINETQSLIGQVLTEQVAVTRGILG